MSARLSRAEADGFLKATFTLLKAQALYPAGHTAVQKANAGLEHALHVVFLRSDSLLLARADGYVVVGEVAFLGESPQIVELSRRMQARTLEGVVLRSGIPASEVTGFFEWLASGSGLDWRSAHISTTLLSREGSLWSKAERLYGSARQALEQAYHEVEAGHVPDPARAQECVGALSELLAENPSVLPALSLIKDYDRYTFHHSVNVCLLSLALSRHLGLSEDETDLSGVAGLFHDIGKTRAPVGVIRKPGRLTEEEWRVIRSHPVDGGEIAAKMPRIPSPVPRLVYEHHMRFDGGGYPARPPGSDLHRLSLVVAVADVYDAMTSHRTYNSPLPLPKAMETMAGMKGAYFDPETLDAFATMLGPIPVGSLVRMTTGEVGVVSKVDSEGEVSEMIVVTGADGRDIPRASQVPRSARISDIAGSVQPLSRRIDPVDVLSPRC